MWHGLVKSPVHASYLVAAVATRRATFLRSTWSRSVMSRLVSKFVKFLLQVKLADCQTCSSLWLSNSSVQSWYFQAEMLEGVDWACGFCWRPNAVHWSRGRRGVGFWAGLQVFARAVANQISRSNSRCKVTRLIQKIREEQEVFREARDGSPGSPQLDLAWDFFCENSRPSLRLGQRVWKALSTLDAVVLLIFLILLILC